MVLVIQGPWEHLGPCVKKSFHCELPSQKGGFIFTIVNKKFLGSFRTGPEKRGFAGFPSGTSKPGKPGATRQQPLASVPAAPPAGLTWFSFPYFSHLKNSLRCGKSCYLESFLEGGEFLISQPAAQGKSRKREAREALAGYLGWSVIPTTPGLRVRYPVGAHAGVHQ